MSGAQNTRGAGFSLVGRDKCAPEDRWALAELDGFVIGAVADGISDPLGTGLTGGRLAPSGSGAVADEAVGAFVERASRLVEGGEQDARVIVREAFVAAELAARTLAWALRSGGSVGVGVEGGAAFVVGVVGVDTVFKGAHLGGEIHQACSGVEGHGFGRGRARRWMTPPVPGFTTTLLLPAPLPTG